MDNCPVLGLDKIVIIYIYEILALKYGDGAINQIIGDGFSFIYKNTQKADNN